MKKLILTIITLSIIAFNGCYDPDTATVRINLGNIPIAPKTDQSFIDKLLGIFEKNAYAQTYADTYVDKIHLAALSGQTVLATASLDASEIEVYNIGVVSAIYVSYLDLKVPAGDDITILVVGESYNTDNNIYYASLYGYSMVDLKPGETAEVKVSVYNNVEPHGNFPSWESLVGLNAENNETFWSISWNSPGFKVKYKLYFEDQSSGIETLVYEGYDYSATYDSGYSNYNLYLDFEMFGIKSLPFNVNNM